MSNKKTFLSLLLFCMLATLPFLGLTEFNTKGEPRESIVAVSMLQNNDWILPTNNGGDIAYKPPFFHWCIAAAALLTGGEVTLFTSRFPSALAAIVMLMACYLFYSRRTGKNIAVLTVLITFTFFEIHRAAFTCRVDMMMTSLMVLALLSLYRWDEKGMKGIPLCGIIFMGLATLTKGPVGIVLPSLVMGCHSLLQGRKFWLCVGKYSMNAILALVLPALWYIEAYQRGGENFLNLVMEENLGRFLGRMSYASHERAVTYNFVTVIAGTLPWTILGFISLFFIRWRKPQFRYPSVLWQKLKGMDPYRLFSLISILVIFIFYSIPKSKRSVYLMPIYPFIAYYLANGIKWLVRNHPRSIRLFGWIISSAGFILLLAFSILKYGFIPDSIAGTGKHAIQNLAFLKALESIPLTLVNLILVILPAFAIWKFVRYASDKKSPFRTVYSIIAVIVSINISMDGVYIPALLSSKSDKDIAEDVTGIVKDAPLASYVKTPMLHFFTVNWYMGDKVRVFHPEKDDSGYLLVGERDYTQFEAEHSKSFTFEKVYTSSHRSCDIKQKVLLVKYARTEEGE